MESFTSFTSSAVHTQELNDILADYLALERVRIFRRLLVPRFGVLALVAVVAGLWHWVSAAASSVSVLISLVPPVWVCLLEWQRGRRLARRLAEIPAAVTHEVLVPRRSL